MSMTIRSGCSARAAMRPVSASTALSTVWSAFVNNSVISFRFAGLSSTTSTRAIRGIPLLRYQGAPYFGDEAEAAHGTLFDDPDRVVRCAGELRPVRRGDLLGGHDQNRDERG